MPFRFESQAGKRKVERNAGIGFATETKRMWLRGAPTAGGATSER